MARFTDCSNLLKNYLFLPPLQSRRVTVGHVWAWAAGFSFTLATWWGGFLVSSGSLSTKEICGWNNGCCSTQFPGNQILDAEPSIYSQESHNLKRSKKCRQLSPWRHWTHSSLILFLSIGFQLAELYPHNLNLHLGSFSLFLLSDSFIYIISGEHLQALSRKTMHCD